MRFRPSSRAVFAGASLAIASCFAPVRLTLATDILVGSTLIPTSSFVSTSGYIPTSYVVPTATILPTSSLVTTSSILPTSTVFETSSFSSYYPTSYVSSYRRGGLFGRRLVERTSYYGSPTSFLTPTSYYSSPTTFLTPTVYTPTSYIAPTSTYLPTSYLLSSSAYVPTTYLSRSVITPTSYLVDDGLITTSVAMAAPTSICSETTSEPTPTRAINPVRNSTPTNSDTAIYSQKRGAASAPAPAERAPSSQVQPEDGTSSGAGSAVPEVANPRPESAPPAKPVETSPPSLNENTQPIVPGPGQINQPKDEAINRTSSKPVTYSTRPSVRNILRGRVVSFDTGRPEEAVRVILSNRTGKYEDKPTQTDADGEFKISLPDGDWVVKVMMPSNSVYPVGRTLTASAGQVLDPNGKSVGELIITR